MQKNYGLLYIGKDDKEYLYKSYYTIEEVVVAIDSKQFKAIEKKKIIIIKLEDHTVTDVKVEGEVK